MAGSLWDMFNWYKWYWLPSDDKEEQPIPKKRKIKRKPSSTKPRSWKCTYCTPQVEFLDYFEYSDHFFEEHIQPKLEELSEAKAKL